MVGGNGVDLGTVVSMLGQLLSGQEQLRVDVAELKVDVTALKAEASTNKFAMAGLRQEVALYHASVVGHGIGITELQERVQRIEDHLQLPPIRTH